MTIRVTDHAIERYRERVADVDFDTALAALTSAIVQLAIDFGAHFIRLPGRQRIVLDGNCVVTVLPSDMPAGRLDPRRDVNHRSWV